MLTQLKAKIPGLDRQKKGRKNHKGSRTIDWGEVLHIAFNAVLPFALVALINNDLSLVAVLMVFLSKWRMFAMRVNHLPANIRANLTDLTVKLSLLSFMVRAEDLTIQLILAAGYATWLLLIKPQAGRLWIAIQAMISQIIGITALMWASDVLADPAILIGIWAVVYGTSFHYLSTFDEPLSRTFAKIWAVFAVQLAWIFLHWNLAYFEVIPQYALVQGALSFIAGDLYTAQNEEKAIVSRYRAYVLAIVIVTVVMILSGDWSGQLV